MPCKEIKPLQLCSFSVSHFAYRTPIDNSHNSQEGLTDVLCRVQRKLGKITSF